MTVNGHECAKMQQALCHMVVFVCVSVRSFLLICCIRLVTPSAPLQAIPGISVLLDIIVAAALSLELKGTNCKQQHTLLHAFRNVQHDGVPVVGSNQIS